MSAETAGALFSAAETEEHLAWVLDSWHTLRERPPAYADSGRIATFRECGDVEATLGVEPGLLSSCAGYARSRAGISRSDLVSPDVDAIEDAEVAALVARLADEDGTGVDWLLGASLAVRGHTRVIERIDDLAEPLLLAMIRSCHRVYRQTTLAGTLLASVPEAQESLLQQAHRLLTDPSSQNHRQPLMLLEHIPTAQSAALVLDVVESENNPFVSGQARRVLTSQVARGLLGDAERSRLGVMVLARWRADPRRASDELRELVAAMPPGFREALDRAAPESEEPPAADTRGFDDLLAAHIPGPDPHLTELLHIAFADQTGERRHLASVFIASSAYREVVAEVVMQMMEYPATRCPLRGRAGELVRYVCTDGQRLRLQKLLADPDPAVAATAAQACGQLRPSLLLDQSIRSHLTMEPGPVNRSLLYALGMHGSPALPLLVESPSAPEWVTTAAQWWIRVGPGLR